MNPEDAISPNRIRIVMSAHGVGLGYVAVGLQTFPVLAGLLVLQLDAAAHQVDEDVEVVVLKIELKRYCGFQNCKVKGRAATADNNFLGAKILF
jgi:hypothetical protein